jgi:hypothetical protein
MSVNGIPYTGITAIAIAASGLLVVMGYAVHRMFVGVKETGPKPESEEQRAYMLAVRHRNLEALQYEADKGRWAGQRAGQQPTPFSEVSQMST